MAEINPARINQPRIDTGAEVTQDGVPISQQAAPTSQQRQAPVNNTPPVEVVEQQQQANENQTQQQQNQEQTTTTENTPTQDNTNNQEQTNNETAPDNLVDFSNFLEVKDAGIPTEKPKTPVEQKETTKVDESQTQQRTPSKETQTQQQQRTQPQARDYSDLDADIAPLFKNMSNDAFNKIKPIVIEHKRIKTELAAKDAEIVELKKGGLPPSYHDNPNGFVLDPAYLAADSQVATAETILNHWERQAEAIRQGAAEIDVLGTNEQGQLVIKGKAKADKNVEGQVGQIIAGARNQLVKVAATAETLKTNFATRYQAAQRWLSDYEGRAYQVFNTEQGKQFIPQVEAILKEFPVEYRNHPLARMAAKGLMTNNHLATLLIQMQQKMGNGNGVVQQQQTQTAVNKNGKQTAQEQQRRAGPTTADTGAASSSGKGSGKGGNDEVTFDAFNRAKEGVD